MASMPFYVLDVAGTVDGGRWSEKSLNGESWKMNPKIPEN